jgi:arabinogalactan oligomer/maltooligosaccharide transport system substrate-binding protein
MTDLLHVRVKHIAFTLRSLLLLALLALLGACNRDTPPDPTPTPMLPPVGIVAAVGATVTPMPTPSPTPVSGRVLLWHSWAANEGDALVAALTAYTQRTPGVQIATLFVAPHELPAAYAEAVHNGSGPDLVLMSNWWLAELVAAGSALPLDDLLPPDAANDYWPGAWASFRLGGRLYGLPAHYSVPALYVNSALLNGAPPVADTTALLEAARNDPAQGIGLYANLYHVVWGFPAYGASLLDADGRVILDQSAGASAFLTWLIVLNQTPGSYVSTDYGMLLDRFKKGEFAYFVDGPWALTDLRTALGDSLIVTTLPAGPAGAARPWLYSDGLLINPTITPDQQRLALDLARFITGPEAARFLSAAGLLPTARGASVDDPRLAGFARQAATADAMPIRPEMEHVWSYGGDMLVKALIGNTPPPAIIAETTALINDANGK